jgi:membrane carboxypeptidase/penicillin-binding protein
MTSAFSVFATMGTKLEPIAITRNEDHEGNIIFEAKAPEPKWCIRAELLLDHFHSF